MGSILNSEEKIRVSYGTAQRLRLKPGKSKEETTTAYLMLTGEEQGCRGGCTFCPQSKGNQRWLSRVSWPLFEINEVREKIKDSDLSRICIQIPDVPDYESKSEAVLKSLQEDGMEKPISLSAPPLEKKTLKDIKGLVDRIGVGIDAATNEIRKEKKPNYDPMVFWHYLGSAVDIFGKGKATAHIIVGLGENLEELGLAVKKCMKVGAEVSLFSYKKKEEEVDLKYYRQAQLTRALLAQGLEVKETLQMVLNEPEEALKKVDAKKAFQTRGCPDCNRPYYTSSPRKEHRNYPREPTEDEMERIIGELGIGKMKKQKVEADDGSDRKDQKSFRRDS